MYITSEHEEVRGYTARFYGQQKYRATRALDLETFVWDAPIGEREIFFFTHSNVFNRNALIETENQSSEQNGKTSRHSIRHIPKSHCLDIVVSQHHWNL